MATPRNLSATPLHAYVTEHGAPVPVATPAALAQFRSAVTARGAVCVVLAAGQGSRFVADVPKVLYPFAGRPLAMHAVLAAVAADMPVVVIVGFGREAVMRELADVEGDVTFVVQEEQLGTGHAVYLARFALPEHFEGDVLVTYADNPGVDCALVKEVLAVHAANGEKYGESYGATVLTGSRKGAGQGAAAYGRIVRQRKDGGSVVDIVEKKTILKLEVDGEARAYGGVEWNAQELDDIDEFNSGIVVAKAREYMDVLGTMVASQTKFNPPKYEYYATDFVKAFVAKGMVAEGWKVPEESMWKLEGANTLEELKELEMKQVAKKSAAQTAEEPRVKQSRQH